MNETKWVLLQAEANLSVFIKALAVIIWTPYQIVNRAVDLKKVRDTIRLPGHQ